MNFREKTKSDLQPEHCSVGTIIKSLDNKRYVIVSHNLVSVTFMNLKTFEIHNKSVTVEDIHLLSKDELRSLVGLLPEKDHAFSDYEFNYIGLKGFK